MLIGIVQRATHSDEVVAQIAGYSEKQIWDWLDELETLGFLESFSLMDDTALGRPDSELVQALSPSAVG